jgi:hypothetical protein
MLEFLTKEKLILDFQLKLMVFVDHVHLSSVCNKAKGARYTFEEWAVMAAALKKYRSELKAQI